LLKNGQLLIIVIRPTKNFSDLLKSKSSFSSLLQKCGRDPHVSETFWAELESLLQYLDICHDVDVSYVIEASLGKRHVSLSV
jgi:hypothetical protein